MRILHRSLEIARALYPDQFDQRRCLHWSFAWDKNKLIAVAENKQRTSPRNLYNKPPNNWGVEKKGTCSELGLFLRIKNTYEKPDYSRIVIVNVRIDREQKIKNSKPCDFCKSLIRYIGNKALFFTTEAGNFEKYE